MKRELWNQAWGILIAINICKKLKQCIFNFISTQYVNLKNAIYEIKLFDWFHYTHVQLFIDES